MGVIKNFLKEHFLHFNAAELIRAADGYQTVLDNNGVMMVTLAGAMSTAELGKSLAKMIRANKIHAICCTGANLEEDIFNLVAHNHYKSVPKYRYLSAKDEKELLDNQYNRVTDTCIPEEMAFRKLEKVVHKYWKLANDEGKSYAPHEFLYMILRNKELEKEYQIDPQNSWMIAAMEKNLPIFTPGWADSTLGNIFCAHTLVDNFKVTTVEHGITTMQRLITWYTETQKTKSIGFFQIGGGIAGDFPICVVPLLNQDLKKNVKLWQYFCQISDSTTSYGSYSGAVPNEKITWGKLDVSTPSFVIESDATIVAPLIFAYLLDL